MTSIYKQPDESDFDYHKRLVMGKLADKTLTDIDYSELAPFVFGKEYSPDVARRMMYGSRYTLDLIGDMAVYNASSDDIVREIAAQTNILQKERIKFRAEKLASDRLFRQHSRFELFYENIKSSIESLPVPEYKFTATHTSNEKREFLLGLADIHYGANFISVNNKYSRQICKERFEYLFSCIVEKVKKENIETLNILNVADTIQGILRVSDLQLNEIPVVEAVVEISRLIANFLNELSPYCYINYYHVTSANHSQTRPLGTKASELATEDMEKIIVNYISDLLLGNERVNVYGDVDKDYTDITIAGWECIAMHGHQIKSTRDSLKDLSNLHRKFYDYVFLGHTHAGSELVVGEGYTNNTEVLILPSFIGSDPYSDKLLCGGKAMCKLYEFDPVYGHVGTQNIILN